MLPSALSLIFVSFLCRVGDSNASPVQVPLALSPALGELVSHGGTGLKGRFLHLTDLHPDMYYRPDTSESTACHRRKPKKEKERGGFYGLPYGDCDSPFALTNFTLDFLDKHWAKEIDFVIWTGDSARHDNDRKIPRTPDEIYELNRAVVHRMNEIFTSRGIPVVPTLGNNDVWPHNIMTAGPNSITNEYSRNGTRVHLNHDFDQKIIDIPYDCIASLESEHLLPLGAQVHAEIGCDWGFDLYIWRSFIPFESFQVFQRGGYYSVEVVPDEVAAISLNTMYFYDSNKAVGGCEYGDDNDPGNLQFDWLEVQLDRYRERGMQVWVSGHVPPSPGNYFPGCFVRYADLVLRYQDTILGHLFGHMNVDHFFFLEMDDTNLPDESLNMARKTGEVGEESHSSLAEVLLQDFSMLPKKSKTDLDEYAVINVGPSVVPNPYLPTFRIYAYNATGEEDTGHELADDEVDSTKKSKKDKKKKKKGSKRKHGHRHPKKDTTIDCKKKENRGTWACRPRKPHYASKDSPSRQNRRWTPLGYAQYWMPGLGEASKDEKPKYKLEYTTVSGPDARRLFPMKELPKSLRGSEEGGVAKKGKKYTPYQMGDLTIGSYLLLARRLGDEKEKGLRELFQRYMYQK